MRRFSCSDPVCPEHIFAERHPQLTKAHARATSHLKQAHHRIGLEFGGEARASLACALGTLVQYITVHLL
ncbi:MAG: hypothetical protein N2C14_02695 [Planctomycetales bacterium]